MSLRSIHPQPGGTPAHLSSTGQLPVYELGASGFFPLVDVSRSIRSRWLHGDAKQGYVRFTRRWTSFILGGYVVGYIAFWVVLLVPARLGRWIALAASLPATFTCAVYFLLLRYEIVVLVVRTYEFWFFTVSNTIAAVLLGLYLNDARALIVLPIWFTLENNILADANTIYSRVYVSIFSAMLVLIVFLLVAVSFEAIDGTRTFELLWIDVNRQLLVQDVLLHGYSTQVIVLARNIYRRRTTSEPPQSHASPQRVSTIRCVTLRARMRLRLVGDRSGYTTDVLTQTESSKSTATHLSLVRLALVPVTAHFCADAVTIPAVRRVLLWASGTTTTALRSLLLVFAHLGLSLCVASAVLTNSPHANEIRVVSFVCSAIFITCLLSATQRQLLRRLVFTFDFAFLSIQLFVVHGCLCDMLGWGYASLPVVTMWMWIQWVPTCDALTPIVKTKWGIHQRLPAIVLVVFIASQVLVFVLIILEGSLSRLHNRVLISLAIHGHKLEMRVIPTLLSRLALLFGWSWKILWRMWTTLPGELLMIQGSLTYANPRRMSRHDNRTRSSAS